MILLTIPIFFPMVSGLDFGLTPEDTAIWFGILVLIVVEVGLITPPVGMNLFVIHSMARDVRIRDTYRGVLPFVASDLLRVVVLVLAPRSRCSCCGCADPPPAHRRWPSSAAARPA